MSVHQFIRHQPEHSMSLKPSTVEEINSDVLDMGLLNAFEELQIDDEADLIVELIDLYRGGTGATHGWNSRERRRR